jgi:myo-inositol-1(or 4)-monophosphatase
MDHSEVDHALEVAKRAARQGGEIARARLSDPGYLKWTGRRDVTTEASFEVQSAVVRAISSEYAKAEVFSKLGPEDATVPVGAADLWLVDPASGSLNFGHGVPHFGITVALRSKGTIHLGVVYDPCRDEMFEATPFTPARLNGRRIIVGRILEGQEAWNSAFIGTDWPQGGKLREQAKAVLGMMESQVLECNLMGSPALGICYVAAGRLHLYWHLEMTIWDVAASGLILEQAGGILTDRDGLSWLYSDGGYIASNNVIHGWALNCIQSMTNLEPPDPRKPRPLPEPRE